MSKKYVDYKQTIWCRAHFKNDADMQKVIQELENTGDVDCIFDEDLGFEEDEVLYDTSENMTPEENDGQPTIEVYQQHEDETVNFQDLIWNNENKNNK
jgi:hypothetical protein